jgi:hypothetical protein
MTQIIVPNNTLPATHFMEVFYKEGVLTQDEKLYSFKDSTPICHQSGWILHLAKAIPVAIFRIREKLPTKKNI